MYNSLSYCIVADMDFFYNFLVYTTILSLSGTYSGGALS